jgi:hypothetical protein
LVAVRHYRRDILRRGIGGKEKLDWIDFQGFQQTRALIDESVSSEDGACGTIETPRTKAAAVKKERGTSSHACWKSNPL